MDIRSKLSKKYVGLPVVAFLIMAIVGSAVGVGYLVYQDRSTGEVKEAVMVNKKKGFDVDFYPNQKIGSVDGCAKYMIVNEAPVDQNVVIDIVESESNIDEKCEWYGLSVVPSQESWASNSVASYGLGHISKGPGTAKHTYSFTIGTVEYEVGPDKPSPEDDSSYWRVFVDGKLKGDVDPGEITAKIRVLRN